MGVSQVDPLPTFPPLPPPFLKAGGEGGRLVATSPVLLVLDEGADKRIHHRIKSTCPIAFLPPLGREEREGGKVSLKISLTWTKFVYSVILTPYLA